MGKIGRLDRRLFSRVARAKWPGAESVLPRLSEAANNGMLWFATAGLMSALGGPTARRAAVRGVCALAVASLTTNTVAKWTTRRKRPLIDDVPFARRLTRQPRTTSFPSGHSASAAAFAAGVAVESGKLGLLVAPLAASVAFSRIYTGVHYPGDVLAGTAIGVAAAALTRAVVPPAPPAHDRVLARADVPGLPRGRGLAVVVNEGSGRDKPGHRRAADRIGDLLPEARVLVREDDGDLMDLLERAARQGSALGVCGGDGTVNAAAGVALRHGLPLAVFPGGTLNHFALDLGIGTFEDTAHAVEHGDAVPVDLAMIHDADGQERHFVNTFSVGIYPEFVRVRESLERRIGKLPAAAVALARVLPRATPLELTLDGEPWRVWLLFAGNGSYSPEGLIPSHRRQLDDGVLDIRLVDADRRLARVRLAAAVLTGTMERSPVYLTGRVRRIDLSELSGAGDLAFDGEVAQVKGDLHLDKLQGALRVYRPRTEQDEFRARSAAGSARLNA
ncbi:phosphatase PAP2 family protein [Nonomuraea sp. NBC_01738]|uniref:bifunctional phosphatase PAP2/diacylglycerol kinase family protein n=1 Tax=Nonomuraea sp. NBC_01738 TaxID=2976003 RepID=UPI002E1022A6|nr:phosphatase PAP2 family protein [Nonomuraea sp. NBC_01738]